MTAAALPEAVCEVFDRFITTEYTTVARGRPITWPVTPYHHREEGCVDITTGLGYPKKAHDARANPKVALLFSDPNGSGMDAPPMVLVQGTADVDDRDLEANRERYWKESLEKLPATESMHPPKFMRGAFSWYYTRLYVHVRPERVYVWPKGDVDRRAGAARLAHGGGALGPRRGARRPARPARGRDALLGPADGGAGRALPERRALDRLARRLSVLGPGADRRRSQRAGRAAGGGRGRRAGPSRARLPSRARARAEVRVAARTSRFAATSSNGMATGSWCRTSWSAASSCPPGCCERYRENFSKMLRYRRIAKRELAKR